MISSSVLFANDDVLTQWIMTEVLRDAGFGVVGVCRGREVMDLLSDGLDFSILLVDLDLIDPTGGCDIGACWRRALPGRPVIYTGANPAALVQPLQFHESFLRAPFTAGALLRTIDTALEDASFPPVIPPAARRIHHVH